MTKGLRDVLVHVEAVSWTVDSQTDHENWKKGGVQEGANRSVFNSGFQGSHVVEAGIVYCLTGHISSAETPPPAPPPPALFLPSRWRRGKCIPPNGHVAFTLRPLRGRLIALRGLVCCRHCGATSRHGCHEIYAFKEHPGGWQGMNSLNA
jgi:hypothetical protein